MPKYEMRSLDYREYLRFCKTEGIEPVAEDAYTFDFLHDFLTQHKIPNAIWDRNGLKWKDHIELYGSMDSYTPIAGVN